MSWRGTKGGIKSAKMGHDVIMSPTSHCYFDYSYQRLPLKRVYSFNPVPENLPADKKVRLLGVRLSRLSAHAGIQLTLAPYVIGVEQAAETI